MVLFRASLGHRVFENSSGLEPAQKGGLKEDEPARRIVQTYEVAERAVIGLDQLLGPTTWNCGWVSCPVVQQGVDLSWVK